MATVFRVPDELSARVERITKLLTARASGVPVRRSSTLLEALERGVSQLEAELKKGKKGR